ncbi:transglutaminase domain-containing protein [Tessaracoccus oleiagri]|uniref:Transglutaminase-like superfamily protein n=1 Tax=Tessaracoccus oleiagri TaxID=686624 RepID=A0A1G9I9R6_9ACTN|nr:transglutaminase domain-containing protein [Tessaracoccus oleiagri]SDL21593.1 Transglutaminase-like superfamily protein [Tessaracoccus oleiagri]
MTRARRAAAPDTPWRGSVHRTRWAIVDAVALLLLGALVCLAFLPVYGTAQLFVAVLGFAALGMGIAFVGTVRQWPVGGTVLAAVMGWLLLGGPLAMPSSTIGYVVPTWRTLMGLVVGPVTAWRDMLTLDPPIGETFNLLVVPALIGYLLGLLGYTISLRSARPMLAWVPAAVGYLVAALFGATVALWPVPSGLAFFVVVLVWTTWRRQTVRDHLSDSRITFKPVRVGLALAMLLVAGGAGVALAPVLAGTAERDNLRAHVEIPIELTEHRSPLQAFRANITKHRAETLFEVRGARPGDIVRLATLDTYDGLAYRVSTKETAVRPETSFKRVGQWIADDTPGEDLDASITVHGYDGVWVPTIGRTISVRFQGDRSIPLGENFFYNHATGTAVDVAGLRAGDAYALESRVPTRPSKAEIGEATAGRIPQPRITGAPDQVRVLALRWTEGISGAGAQALRLEEQLQQGYFSHGQPDEVTSVPGHSQHRIAELLADPALMIGDHEQYAVAMALMARELGIPARVLYGYQVDDSPQVTGDDVGAWPELYLDGLGWVRFDPTPPKDRVADDIEPPEPPKPQPYVENPPPPPLKPDVPPPDEQLPIDQGEPPSQETTIDWAQVGAMMLIAGIPLLTIVVPIALVLGLKWRRRVRRRNDPEVANRVAGAWLELVDKARDLGRSPSFSATRSEQAEQLTASFPRVTQKADLVALAKEADWLVFAPGEPAERVASEYWRETGAARGGMRRSVGWLKWVLSGLSTKSFRRTK